MDVFLAEPLATEAFRERLQAQMPPALQLVRVTEIPVQGPAIQAQLRAAEYELTLCPDADFDEVQGRIDALLATERFPWQHVRDKETRRYDLRPLVLSLRLERRDACLVVVAMLRAEDGATARPDQVAAAIGLSGTVERIERTVLVLAEPAASNA
jgi:radical SAM-linked protein